MPLPNLSALFNLPPERAAQFLADKGLKLTGPYWELDGPGHSRNFTVANLAKLDVLADIKAAVQGAIDAGQTEKWFREQLVDTLRKKGWWGPAVSVDPDTLAAKIVQQGSFRRLQTIYRTNLQSAYMAGRHRQAMEQIERAPYAEYLAVRDSRTRPAHRDLHGKVFRLDSPAWGIVSPPRGYNCRCRARYLSQAELDARGLKLADDVRLVERTPPGEPPRDPITAETVGRWVQRGISLPDPTDTGKRIYSWTDVGWDHLPGSDGAERALVDKLMKKAKDLGEGVREAVATSVQARVAASTKPVRLRKKIQALPPDTPSWETLTIVEEWLDAHVTKGAKPVKVHGMPDVEQHVSVQWEGVTYTYKQASVLGRENAARSILYLAKTAPLPRRLIRHVKQVTFSDQGNKNDAYWAEKYKIPGFTSWATGGGGQVVAYKVEIGLKVLAHEAGHNLAEAKYGSSSPGGDFLDAAIGVEPPPTEYGKASMAEDFAESVMLYFTDRPKLRAVAPLRYKVIDRLMKEDDYGG